MHRHEPRLSDRDHDGAQNLGVIYADDDPDLRVFVKRMARDLIANGSIGDMSTVGTGEELIRRVTLESPGYYRAGIFDWDMGAVNLNGVAAIQELYRRLSLNGFAATHDFDAGVEAAMIPALGLVSGDGSEDGAGGLSDDLAVIHTSAEVLGGSSRVKAMPFKSVLYSGGPRGDVDALIEQLTEALSLNCNFLGAVHKDVPPYALLMHVANAVSLDPAAQERANQAFTCLTANFYKRIGALDLAPDFIRESVERGCRQCVCGEDVHGSQYA